MNPNLKSENGPIRHVTSELAAKQIGCRYDTVLIASARMRELRAGAVPFVKPDLTEMGTAIREIESGFVGYEILDRIKLTAEPLKKRHRR